MPSAMFRARFLPALALAAILAPAAAAQEYWTLMPRPTTHGLNKVCFLDRLAGWVAGDSGTILKTTDGGWSWETQDPRVDADIRDIHMVDAEAGFALAVLPPGYSPAFSGTIILGTTNGGLDWNQDPHDGEYFQSVFFTDPMHGWVGGLFGHLLGTSDGGANWFVPAIDSSDLSTFPIHTIKFTSPETGFAVGGYREITGIVWRTADSGQSWSLYGTGDELFDIEPGDPGHMVCAGGGLDDGAGVALSTDAGATWSFGYVGFFGQAKSLSFRTPAEGWSTLGEAGTTMTTSDSGRTWKKLHTPDSSNVVDVMFPDSLTGFMVGAGGTIFKYTRADVAVPVEAGWNLLSLPVTAGDRSTGVLYPSSASQAFGYIGRYAPVDSLDYGSGYWIKFDAAETAVVRGTYRMRDSISVRKGWNIVGSISVQVPSGSIIEIPGGLAVTPFFSFLNGYHETDTLKPGGGYWVKASQAGVLVLDTHPPASSADKHHRPR